MKNLINYILEKYNIPPEKYKLIEEFCAEYKIAKISAIPISIQKVLTYDKDFGNLCERYNAIKLLNKDSVSEKSFILRYGETEGLKRRLQRQSQISKSSSKSEMIKKFGEEEFRKKRASNLATLEEKYGKEIADCRWNSYLHKFQFSHSLDGYIKKYGHEEGTALYKNKINRAKRKNSFDGYLDRFGDSAKDAWENKNKKIGYKNSKEYYIEIYGEEYKDILRRVKDSSSLQYFKSKYDDALANKLYIDRCKKMAELAKEKQFILHFKPENFYSKISQIFFTDLHELLGIDSVCMYGSNGGEYFIYDKDTKNIYFYDFIYKNKIIEFHGDYWHKNPVLYEPDLEIIQRDKLKESLAISRGKNLLTVWEYNYYKNPSETLQTALNFLQND